MDVLTALLLFVVVSCSFASVLLSIRERRRERAHLRDMSARFALLVVKLEALTRRISPTDDRR